MTTADVGEVPAEVIAVAERLARWAHRRKWGDHDDLFSAAMWAGYLSTLTPPSTGDVYDAVGWAATFICNAMRDVRNRHLIRAGRETTGRAADVSSWIPDRRSREPQRRSVDAEFWKAACVGLSEKQREAVLLVYRDGFTVSEAGRLIANGYHRSVSRRLEIATPTLRRNLRNYLAGKPLNESVSAQRPPFRVIDDESWARCRPLIPSGGPRGGVTRGDTVRNVVSALRHIWRDGYAVHEFPDGAPPRRTIRDYHKRWRCDGTLERLREVLASGDDSR